MKKTHEQIDKQREIDRQILKNTQNFTIRCDICLMLLEECKCCHNINMDCFICPFLNNGLCNHLKIYENKEMQLSLKNKKMTYEELYNKLYKKSIKIIEI